jgi:hypothetical protein
MSRGALLFVIFILQSPAMAEYRVFRLKIDRLNPDGSIALTRETLSVLDPRQYQAYYPVAANERVLYTQTWRCHGRTDQFKPFCEAPSQNLSEKSAQTLTPASNRTPTAVTPSTPTLATPTQTDLSPAQKP